MASLHIEKGINEGKQVPINGDLFTLGRNPDCDVVIGVTSVSREHARIVRVGGQFFIEDLRSRNKTFLNNADIPPGSRVPLKNNDRIRICDFVATFKNPAQEQGEEEEEDDSSSTIEATLTAQGSEVLLDSQPQDKLRALIDISGDLNKTLQLDALLPKIADTLFHVFRQADRCFIIQTDEETKKLMPRVVRTRRERDESTARFSKTIVRRCLEGAQAYLTDDASKDNQFQLSQSVIDFRIRSVMCVPMCNSEGKALGVVQLDTQDRSKKFTTDDLKLLWAVANQAAVALENARLHEETIAQEKLKRDLELAHQVQQSFLPRQFPEVAGYDFAAHYQPAQAVGGDYYTFVRLPGGRLAVVLADVAGKGIPAALLVARLSSDTKLALLTEPDPARAVGKLNDMLYEFTSLVDRFVTLALAVLDPASHTVTLVNAGHLSPLLYRPEPLTIEEAVPNRIAGVPLGIMDGYTFDSCQVTLEKGDRLLFFTDGVTDPIDRNKAPFGNEGILRTLRGAGAVSSEELVNKLFDAVQTYAAGSPPFDDITLVCMGRTA
jgi:sigma-B regulation protein RsbU (phosphoserine phosphatase)